MDLADRRRRHRLVIEAREQLDGTTEFGLENFTHERGMHRRRVGLQAGERFLVGREASVAECPASTIEIIWPAFISTPREWPSSSA